MAEIKPMRKIVIIGVIGVLGILAKPSKSGQHSCTKMLLGKTISEAHEKAVAVSAYVCTQRGAMPLLPAELKA